MSIRYLPEQASRVESGPVQFGEDWPGVFLRGDYAAHLYGCLATVKFSADESPFAQAAIRGLMSTLRSCIVGPASAMFEEPRYTVTDTGRAMLKEGE